MTNKKTVRLNKLVKEFNVSIDRIFSFLESRGIKDLKPNSKVSNQVYMDLLGEFDSEKKATMMVFIRINKLSRVIPALLTNTSISPKSALIAASVASIDSGSVTLRA